VSACGSRSELSRCAFGVCEEPAPGGAPSVGKGGTGALGGSGGATATAGRSSFGGSSGGGQGGTMIAEAGRGGDAGGGGEGGEPPEPPFVLLLVDGSFSMFASSVWRPTYEAIMGEGGPVERYQDRVRFGFAGYRGRGQSSEDDPACADIERVSYALDNTETIRAVYGTLTPRRGYWETPTGHALIRVTDELVAESAEARKYILLFSDGAPDTCATTRPQCGQDRAVFAVQGAFRRGVETRAIGIGYGTEYDCSSEDSRCNVDHFQDLANAGVGLPVQAPPPSYLSLPCAAETGGTLLANYAEEGGLAPFHWAQSPDEVRSAVEAILEAILAEQ
jgi:hypothetical protein